MLPNSWLHPYLPLRELALLFMEPPRSAYDVNFRVGDIPVRIHPLFWLVGVLLGSPFETPPKYLAIWVGAVFISILVHELGHVAAFRYYNEWAHVVLYSFGGLAVPDGCRGGRRRLSPGWPQIVVAFAGPAAGFLFAALLVGVLLVAGVSVAVELGGPTVVGVDFGKVGTPELIFLLHALFVLNIAWGLVNLLPIWPLDGGRIAQELLVKYNPMQGLKQAFLVSVVASGAMALWGAKNESLFVAVMFGYLAYQSYRSYQAADRGYGRPW